MTSKPTIFVHVGLPKTGTTFLQDLMREHAETLADQGLLYPLLNAPDHFLAALDARGNTTFAGVERPHAVGAWAAVVEAAAGAPDRAIISHEVLSTADAQRAQSAMRLLDGHDVHVVVTARDPARQVVADWQESVKHGRSQSFQSYVKRSGLRDGSVPGTAARNFGAQRLPDVLSAWGDHLPADHVHVVTVPPPGSDPSLLWERFAAVLGVREPGRYRPGSSVRRNERLGVADIELLRRVNQALRTRVDRSVRTTLTKDVYAQQVLPAVSTTRPPVLPKPLRGRLDEVGQEWIATIRERGYAVSGDLDDLAPRHADGPSPSDWTATELLDTSVAATVELLAEVSRLRDELRHARSRTVRQLPRTAVRSLRRRLSRQQR